MPQKFIQGATNHLTWVMVDATDFATPESALSAAMTIKIYGMLNTAAGVNFVSSGTGSLTNDIVHVGASATGIYHIALASADLSDASAAFYDVYVVHLSATGAARQTMIIDGERTDTSYLSNVLSYLSNMASNLSGIASDILSSVRGNSDFLSKMSDVLSNAYSAAAQGSSRTLLVQSQLSDLDSRLVSDLSDVRSALSDFQSDFQSRVPKRVATDSQLSNLHSGLNALGVGASAVLSDLYSGLSDLQSSFGAAIPELAQAAPTATPTLKQAVMLPYMALRNKVTATSTLLTISNDAGTVITKKSLSDDGTTYTESELAAGP